MLSVTQLNLVVALKLSCSCMDFVVHFQKTCRILTILYRSIIQTDGHGGAAKWKVKMTDNNLNYGLLFNVNLTINLTFPCK